MMISLLSRACGTCAVLLTLLCASSCFGAALTWTGTGNWNTAANWGGSVPTTGDTGDISSGTATANVTLTGSPAITVTGTGTLFINAFAGPLTASGTVAANSGGQIDWRGNSTDTSLITLGDGAILSRSLNNAIAKSSNALNLLSGATVTAADIVTTVSRTSLGLYLVGPLSSVDSTSTLLVQPATAGRLGPLVLAPAAANTGFTGNVSIQQGPGSTRATLALGGTGALSNVNNVTIGSGAQLRFAGTAAPGSTPYATPYTDPFAAGKVIQVPSGANVDWEGTAGSYTMAQNLRPTLVFHDGSTFGREEIENVLAYSYENIVIGNAANATVSTGRINASVTRTNLALELRGTLSSFDNTATLLVQSDAGERGALNINPSSNNTGFTGNVVLQEGSSSTVSTLVLSGTGALSNVNNITLGNNTILRFNSATNPLPAGYALSVDAGRRIEWEGSGGSYSVAPPTLTFLDGSTFGREEAINTLGIGRANVVIGAGATVTASRINAAVPRTNLGLELRGPLSSGDSNSTLVINPTTAGFVGGLTLNPSSANPFNGNVVIQPGPGGSTPGSLILSSTGALANVSSLTVNSGTILRFANAANPLPDAFAITIPSGGRMEWEGSGNTYTGITPPTITFQDGAELGRIESSNTLAISRDNLVIAPGATVTVSKINTSISRTDLALRLQGTLSGGADTKIVYEGTATGNYFGPLTINSSAANAFAGTFELRGFNSLRQASLVLQGTGPLANAALLDIDEFSTAMVFSAGAGDDIGEIRVRSGGTFRLRDNSGSTLTNTTLTGDGRVRSEAFEDEVLIDQPLRALTLNNTIVSPGLSAGTLTFEAASLTLGTNSQLDIELGSLSDQLVVDGDLILDSSTTLNLSDLAGINSGTYVIATTTGTITGTFGTINSFLEEPYVFEGITYGTNFISVQIGFVPEPGSGLMGGMGLLGGLIFRRRRRKDSHKASINLR